MTSAKRSRKKADSAAGGPPPIRRRWRDYKTTSGRSPVEGFIDKLSDSDAAAVLAGVPVTRLDFPSDGEKTRQRVGVGLSDLSEFDGGKGAYDVSRSP